MSYVVSKNDSKRWGFVWLCDGWVPRGGKLILSVGLPGWRRSTGGGE